jgi:hypothetical protein
MIPKKVHLSWKTKDLLDSESPLITEGVKKLIELNPELGSDDIRRRRGGCLLYKSGWSRSFMR